MSGRLIALGLDATDPRLLEKWMDAGHLPNITALRERGSFGEVQNVDYYRTETSWLNYLTGTLPQETGEWGHVAYDPRGYTVKEHTAFSFDRFPPFYTRMANKRVAVFDPPLAKAVEGVNGIQVLGWGTEVNQCLRESRPPNLMQELIDRHGTHPLLQAVTVDSEKNDIFSYSIPSSYDLTAMNLLSQQLQTGAGQRAGIMLDLLNREHWDLFIGVFSETHTAAHLLWHLSQAHPLRARLTKQLIEDPMLAVFKAVDSAVGKVVASLSEDDTLILFSIYGIGANVLDLPSMLFLPELLYRWSFPGNTALGKISSSAATAEASIEYPRHWKNEVWRLRSPGADELLDSPVLQEEAGDPLHWQPTNWYRPLWPRMKAFALPTYSEGLIRLNVRGRETAGIVDPLDYNSTCDAICEYLRQVTDARTGKPMVRDIVRTREYAAQTSGNPAPADLIVLWQEETPTDMVSSPAAGVVGPMPYFRSGGHCSRGFLMRCGPGIAAGTALPAIHAKKLTALFMQLLGS